MNLWSNRDHSTYISFTILAYLHAGTPRKHSGLFDYWHSQCSGIHHHHHGFLLHSCWRNPSLLIVQQHRSLATSLQFGPIASWRSSPQHLFGWPLGCLWSCGHYFVTGLLHLLSFSHETCPVHHCLLVQIWQITSVTPVFEQIQPALFLSCSVSPIIIFSILHCVCDHFLQLCFAEGPCFTPTNDCWEYAFIVHFCFQPQWYSFVSHNGVQLAKSSPTKAYSTSSGITTFEILKIFLPPRYLQLF